MSYFKNSVKCVDSWCANNVRGLDGIGTALLFNTKSKLIFLISNNALMEESGNFKYFCQYLVCPK